MRIKAGVLRDCRIHMKLTGKLYRMTIRLAMLCSSEYWAIMK